MPACRSPLCFLELAEAVLEAVARAGDVEHRLLLGRLKRPLFAQFGLERCAGHSGTLADPEHPSEIRIPASPLVAVRVRFGAVACRIPARGGRQRKRRNRPASQPPETPRGRRFLNLLPLTATSCESDLAPRVGRFRTAVLPLDNRFSPEGGVKSGVPVWRRGVAGGGTEPAPKSVWNTPPTASPVASLDSSLSGSQQDMSGNRKGLLLG